MRFCLWLSRRARPLLHKLQLQRRLPHPLRLKRLGFRQEKYLFVRYWVHVEGSGSLPALMIDFPTFFFDAATGELQAR